MKITALSKNPVAPVLLLCGLLLIAGQFFANLHAGWRSLAVKTSVRHPQRYDFPLYAELLPRCVSNGVVDYSLLKHDDRLAKAVEEVETVNPDAMPEQDKLSFWINTFNLLTLKNISDRYPVQDTLSLGQSTSLRKFTIGGELYSLSDIGASCLGPLCKQVCPEAIFLVCDGSLGGPELIPRLIDAENLQPLAVQQAKKFTNNPANAYWEPQSNSFFISLFFKWHEDLFARKYENAFLIVDHFRQKKVDLNNPSYKYLFAPHYDWRLNAVHNSSAASASGNTK